MKKVSQSMESKKKFHEIAGFGWCSKSVFSSFYVMDIQRTVVIDPKKILHLPDTSRPLVEYRDLARPPWSNVVMCDVKKGKPWIFVEKKHVFSNL